ncbi:MAG TPA: glycosyltransferase family 4 protein [Candidatus Binataceae bacterium]|nr:glycosyltransferase family 4 protein [Candidatus Binataceae bacterium]
MDRTRETSNGPVRARQQLRIAQVATLYERIPPLFYGGTERVVSYITEELVRRGHDVTLFASGDSRTEAKLAPGCPEALRLLGKPELGASLQLTMLSDVYERSRDFDIIHTHVDYWSFAFASLTGIPTVATMHGRLNIPELHPVYRRYRAIPLVSISDAQRTPLPFMNWAATIHHGLPKNLLRFNSDPGKYFAFLGRISPEKRPDIAIDVARKVGIPLKIAAKVDAYDRDYFETTIKPRLSPPDVEYIGEISEAEKSAFLGDSLALLFTIDWPEPFGLAMIEALACGTPVIARPCGSVPEILRDGVTGYLADTVDELAAAARKAENLSREACRAEFEHRFTVEQMANRYEQVYGEIIKNRRLPARQIGRADSVDGQS